MIDFSDFLSMRQEISLLVVFIILLVCDLLSSESSRKWLHLLACVLFGLHTAAGFAFPAPTTEAFGGMYVNSPLTILMKNILNMGTFIVFLQSRKWLLNMTTNKQGEFYVITLATLLGMYLMISSRNFMMLYIGVETAALPIACLAAFDKYNRKSAEAGAKFILMSALSSGIMMFGLSYLYGAVGTMYFSDMQSLITGDMLTIMGLILFVAGLGFKVAIVPFHMWAPDVYEGAPTTVTAYLSVVSKGAGVFALVFTLWNVFGNVAIVWHHVLWALAVLTITIGNLFAIKQKDIKRFFAYSSISQAGFILLGVMTGTPQGMTSTVYFILVYLFSNLAAFGVISAVEGMSGRTDIAAYNGLYKTNPKLSFVMMLAVFSLAGIPPFAGFFSKFFIFAAAAEQGEFLLVFIALINTVVSLFYYLMIVRAMFINEAEEHAFGRVQTDGYNKVSLVLCTTGILLVGILSGIYKYIDGISFLM